MNPRSDLDINRDIRRILVHYWIDLGRLYVRSVRGAVMMGGMLARIGGVEEKLSASVVKALFEELGRVGGVTGVYADLENWRQSDGGWREMEKTQKAAATPGQTHLGHEAKTYDITPE